MKGIYHKSLFKNVRTRRILLATIFTFIIFSTYYSIFTYKTLLKDHEESTLMRLLGIVNSTALLIDGEMHSMLMNMYPKKDDIQKLGVDMYFDQIHDLLKKNTEANMLKTPIYTIVFDSTRHVFEFGVSSADDPYFRHTYQKFPDALLENHSVGGMLPPYKDEYGHWLSAFAPIKNKKGQTVALIQADEKYDAFISKVKKSIWNNILLTLLLSAIPFFVLFRILNHILSRELDDKTQLEKANEENKRIGTELAVSLSELKNTDNFRKEMIANFSHDLRTPLSSIKGYLELILQDRETKLITKQDEQKYIQIAYNESLRLNRLVNELFELSKLETGQIKLNVESFSLAELAQDVLTKYQKQCTDRNIALNTEFGDSLHRVKGDIGWIDRLLQNLFDNALKHVQNGGYIKLTIFDKENFQHLKVCNSGIPIPEHELPQVFDRYFKSSNNINNQSTGLGLAIVKKIVEVHHGKVNAEVNGDVTTFRFTLPYTVDQASA